MRPSNRGQGRIFRQKGSPFWYVAYYRNGVELREPTNIRADNPDPRKAERGEKAALALLKNKVSEIAAERAGGPRFLGPAQRRLTVDDMLNALEEDFRIRGKHNIKLVSNLKPLRQHFGCYRATELTSERIDKFITEAREHGRIKQRTEITYRRGEMQVTYRVKKTKPAKNATINRSLQLLQQAYDYTVEHKQISADWVPVIRRLDEKDNVRQGFFEAPDFRRVVSHLPIWLQDFCLWLYFTGWRKGGTSKLRWEHTRKNLVLLPGEDWKNKEAQTMPLVGELAEIIERRRAARAVKTETGVFLSEFIFHHNGKRITDFPKAWATACRKAGVEGKLVHDLCRTAARDFDNSGTSRAIAKKIMGRKTDAIYDRYRIVPEKDKIAGLKQREEYMRKQAEQEQAEQQQAAQAKEAREGVPPVASNSVQ